MVFRSDGLTLCGIFCCRKRLNMGKFENLVGKRYGRLTVIKRVYKEGDKRTYWLCKCDCGNETIVRADHLKSGNTTSCGCLNIEASRRANTTHGKTGTRLYHIYSSMKERTTNPNDKRYKDYGGRGIKVCDEWLSSFRSFYNWAVSNGYSDELTIDRIDVNGGYNPKNCRWTTIKEQDNNKRNNLNIAHNGETRTLAQWSDLLNIKYNTLWNRINKYHWTVEQAFTQ